MQIVPVQCSLTSYNQGWKKASKKPRFFFKKPKKTSKVQNLGF